VNYQQAVDEAKKNGIDGLILTNHYQKAYLSKYDSVEAFVAKYHEEYRKAKSYGESVGVKVYYGIEITYEKINMVHLLAYGVGEEFLLAHPFVFDYTLEQIYDAVHSFGGILVQAHPFRCVDKLVDTAYLDGVEISCHPKYYTTSSQKVKEVAIKENLIITSGADYHGDVSYRPICGLEVDGVPQNINEIVDILTSNKPKTLLIHELFAEKPDRYSYN
jgi:histidinol phosphatase-like PHP family hydrolase